MAAFVVHSVPGSPYGRSVLATLEEKGAAYRLQPVAPGGFRNEPHLSRHPFGKVPVIEHDGFVLYETQAILRYLDRIIPHPPLAPADARNVARMDQILNICDWSPLRTPSRLPERARPRCCLPCWRSRRALCWAVSATA